MKADIRPVQKNDLSRVSQLCQRTNQFNLTSKRYTESDLVKFLDDPEIKMFVLQAEDRFGDLPLAAAKAEMRGLRHSSLLVRSA